MKHVWIFVLLLEIGCNRAGYAKKLHEDAEVATREGRLPDAAAALERVLRFDPADQIALERLVWLRLRMDDPAGAFALATSGAGQSVRASSLRNARVVAAVRLDKLADALSDARSLKASGGLTQATEQALLDALVADALRSTPLLRPAEPLPEAWLAVSFERLLETTDLERTARFFLARPELERSSAVGSAMKQRLLLRAYGEDFALAPELLGALTHAPKTGLEYVGRLEYARQVGDAALAERLEPAADLLQPPYADAWQLGLARLAARRKDWFGVLERTRGAPYAETRSEGRRQALRCVAYLEVGDRRAARAQLEAWLAAPEASQAWSGALLLPELRDAAHELVQLRSVVAKAAARRSPAR